MSKIGRAHGLGNVTPIRVSGRSPARAELAEAIKDFSAAEKVAEAARAAVARAREMVRGARQRLEAAGEAVTAANEATAARAASAAASGEHLRPDRTTRDARAAEQDAVDDVDAARAALATVETALVIPEMIERDAKNRVTAASTAVLAEEVEGAVAEVVRLKSELNAAIGRLTFIHSKAFEWPPTADGAHIRSHFETFNFDRTKGNPVHPVWEAYFQALQRDPDAASPSRLPAA